MKLAIRIMTFVATLAAPVLATTPKPAPATLPPLQAAPPPGPIASLPMGPPILSWTRQMIENLGISSTMKLDFLLHIKTTDQMLNTSTQSTVQRGASEETHPNLLPRSEHWIAPNTSVQGTGQATADGFVNFEPSIITNRFNTADRTTIAFTKFDAANTPLHYWTSTTDYVTFMGSPTGFQFQLPAGTTRANDPLLSENAYNSNIQPNAFPKRTYCIGTTYDVNAQGPTYSELAVWFTDDPGSLPWNRVSPVIDSANNPLVIDKPSIATSWDTTHGTLGYTYAAAVAVNLSTNSHQLRVYRQTATQGFTIVNGQFLGSTNMTSPIIVVDISTADVYLLWVDWTLNNINIARSMNMGSNFGAGATFATGTLLDGTLRDNSGLVRIRSASAIMARPNAANNSIGVVWHQLETDGVHTDVFFNSFDLTTQSWNGVRHIGHTTQNDLRDQWNPALDAASDGTYILTWYDKAEHQGGDDTTNDRYRVFATKINADGSPFDTVDTLVYNSAFQADPALAPVVGGLHYIGDYQDLWEWFGTWSSSTIYIDQSGNQDVYIPRILP